MKFRGDKPCGFSAGTCCPMLSANPGDCPNYEPQDGKILIIKLGALGDVLRTTTLIPALQERFPGYATAWITKADAVPLLEKSGIWKILPWNFESCLWARKIKWNTVICLDKEEGPTSLASDLKATEKFGFGRNPHGLLTPLSRSSENLFRLGIDDELKFKINCESYPKLIAEACNLDWAPNNYVMNLSQTELDWARETARLWGDGPYVGINIGSGDMFAGKSWPLEKCTDLAVMLSKWGIKPVFLGGASEKNNYLSIRENLNVKAAFPGCEFSLREFAALVSQLKVMVSGDSLAMHVAIARGIYCVALFGSTIAGEIEFYGRGEALSSNADCTPCYLRKCPNEEKCMRGIEVQTVFEAIQKGLKKW